ncbi:MULTISPECIES: class I SAM-dependent methyltransferase [Streptomyces]|uniref:class I SAM-dependent methyltransferase n=1 Tax=Streptomyces TaxID=1883 RepID=UPI00163CF820|nr:MULTISPECIES: class I SAM-dependent methyltransferase [Streptomyces]MBC2876563.1 class I SAM-dependent methyltransferase [Streptomyces sp. TYQ1024]UBI40766.1 class I SAM-dependent methyltransferase [Streptomyces mobaraensis]UKW33346.1 class I SAM-dependent methyltransferase [Streptomyces sp. TYQ1024]
MRDETSTEPPPVPGTAGYGEAAEALAGQYESVDFAEVHRAVLHLFPERPGTVLDIGAGSGRDAAALAGRGHRVVAVEPTAALRALGRRLHADRGIEWVDDALPGLRALRGRRFDLVLLTAVWMHLDADERPAAMETVSGLVGPGGRIVLSLRHGPVPPGRRMFPVTADETAALARRHGLAALHRAHGGDPLGRADVTWSHLVLERP